MPIPLDRDATAALSARFVEAADLVRNEFEGLDPHRQYRNAFARLLKADPLGRVAMLGTDQRDMLVPELRRVIANTVRPGGSLFDFGGGDGQTFDLVSDALPHGTTVSLLEPEPEYARRYRAVIAARPHLVAGIALVAGFDEIDAAASRTGTPLPADGSVDVALAIQMIFYLDDLAAGLGRMYRFLRPGGALFVVFADETESYTGLVLRAFADAGGRLDSDAGATQRRLAAVAERRRLLAGTAEGGGGILEVLRRASPEAEPRLETLCQPTRLYGHTLSDLVAVAGITALSEAPGAEKFDAVLRLLEERPELVDLRIEDDGARRGMYSVAQPQRIAVIRRG